MLSQLTILATGEMTVPCKQHWCSLTHLCTCIQLHKDFFWPDLSIISRKGSQKFVWFSVLAHNDKRRKPSRLWKRANRRKNRNRVAELQKQANFMLSLSISSRWGSCSWYPDFDGNHYGLPPSMSRRMTWQGGKIAWLWRIRDRTWFPKCPHSNGCQALRDVTKSIFHTSIQNRLANCGYIPMCACAIWCICVCLSVCACVRVCACGCVRPWALRRGSIFRMTDSRLFCWF